MRKHIYSPAWTEFLLQTRSLADFCYKSLVCGRGNHRTDFYFMTRLLFISSISLFSPSCSCFDMQQILQCVSSSPASSSPVLRDFFFIIPTCCWEHLRWLSTTSVHQSSVAPSVFMWRSAESDFRWFRLLFPGYNYCWIEFRWNPLCQSQKWGEKNIRITVSVMCAVKEKSTL